MSGIPEYRCLISSLWKDVRKVDLNDLPQWSQWPARLIELGPSTIPSRTIEKIDQEYDKEKYAQCLDYFTSLKDVTPERIREFEYEMVGIKPDDEICVSQEDNLYKMSLKEAVSCYHRIIIETIATQIKGCSTVIELGAGYGFNLWLLWEKFPELNYVGGEYSKNAVKIASLLHKDDMVKVEYFNFYDTMTYRIFEPAKPPILVFTVHAIEQLPKSSIVFETLQKYAKIIKTVFHFEPVYELCGDTLLGLMRRRYAQMNDYNLDLLTQLKSRAGIRIENIQANVIGLNPLNPTSIIQWRFSSDE